MTTITSRINLLPNELLDEIFGYVNDKALIRLVYKKWYNATGGAITHHVYYEDSLMEFGKDLQENVELQHIQIVAGEETQTSRKWFIQEVYEARFPVLPKFGRAPSRYQSSKRLLCTQAKV